MAQRPSRPLFIALTGLVVAGHVLAIPVLVFYLAIANADSMIIYNGERMRIVEVRVKAIGQLVVWWPFALGLAYGIWRRRPWARIAVAATFGLPAIALMGIGISNGEAISAVSGLALTVCLWWYFFKNENDLRYFGET